MSSPGVFPNTSQLPAPAAQEASRAVSSDNEETGVTVKSMRLKVLYTFDDQNKTNCLARWPQVLQIRTVAMDETTSIGVIELKTCIQAIVQCSPELVAKLGQDYTVYAYDYSEYENPLVGQGMLSWALAAASPTPEAPAHQSRQLITGRVCKNIQGLFSNGVAETLEVKLRLVPVPTVLQSEYLSSMEKYRELSKVMPAGFDHNEWFSFLQSNPNIAQMANKINAPSNSSGQREGFSMEVVNQLLSPSLTQSSADPFNNPQSTDLGNDEDRDSTPAGRGKPAQKTSRPSSRASVKRPYKRRAKATAIGGNTSGYEEGTDGDDGPTGKKRAKITKTDWNSKTSFGSASESLRVAASTAGSLRLFRPIALAPAPSRNVESHLQEMPRAPTPVPNMQSQAPTRNRTLSQSGLRRDSITSQFIDSQPRQYNSPYQQPESSQGSQEHIRMSIESAMTSPEKNDSAGETPPEFGSSPPVLRTATPQQFSPPPSSPLLPQMPRTDSGFMSGDIIDLFEDEDESRPVEEEDIAVASKYIRRRNYRPAPPRTEIHHGFAIEEVTPGPPELLPTRMLPRAGPKPKAEPNAKTSGSRASTLRAGSTMSDDGVSLPPPKTQNVLELDAPTVPEVAPVMLPSVVDCEINNAPSEITRPTESTSPQVSAALAEISAPVAPVSRPASRMLSRTASAGSLTLPTIAASDPVFPSSSLQQCQSLFEAPHPATDVLAPTDRPDTAGAVSAGAIAKKNNIRLRLETAIDKGEMPPFCSNCGAIETPAWRKAWAQEFKGDPGYHEYSDEPGRVTAIDVLERDAIGKPTAYKIFKKSLAESEDRLAFTEVLLCNPCGIWMSKYKTRRPEDKWAKDQERALERAGHLMEKKPTERKRRERSSKARKAQTGYQGDATSEAYFPSDVLGPVDSAMSFQVASEQQHEAVISVTEQHQAESNDRQRAASVLPMKRTMGNMTSDTASAALRRAIKSSPARWLGTRHSPIELEEDLGSTRRILFPSPRKDESWNVLGVIVPNVIHELVSFHSPHTRSKGLAIETADKENCPPIPLFDDEDEELRKLFEEELTKPSRPTTPVHKLSDNRPFQTPTRPTPNHRPITRSISKSTRSAGKIQMLPQRTPSRTPSTAARRRSPRHNNGTIESPFTATLNRLLREANDQHNAANDSPSRHLDLAMDFSALPELGHSGATGMNSDALTFHLPGFDTNNDFFSTDIPMPSSPPRLFSLYEDPTTMHGLENIDQSMWSDFPMDDTALHSMGQGLVVDENGVASFEMGSMEVDEGSEIKTEPGRAAGEDEVLETQFENEIQKT